MGMCEQMHINSFILLISSRDYFAARTQPLSFIMRPIDLLDHLQFGLQYFLILVFLRFRSVVSIDLKVDGHRNLQKTLLSQVFSNNPLSLT